MARVTPELLGPLLRDAAMSVQAEARRAAEYQVETLKALPGFALSLSHLTLDATGALELRQLAALVLKQFIKALWCVTNQIGYGWADEDEDDVPRQLPGHHAEPPSPPVIVCDAEKAAPRAFAQR